MQLAQTQTPQLRQWQARFMMPNLDSQTKQSGDSANGSILGGVNDLATVIALASVLQQNTRRALDASATLLLSKAF
jgi:hypothetical protein